MLKHCILSVDYAVGWEKTLGHLPAALALLGIEKLTLVYVKETHYQQHLEDTDGLAESHLKDLSGTLAAELQIEVEYQLRHGFPASELVDVAYSTFANMVMVLNRSHSVARGCPRGSSRQCGRVHCAREPAAGATGALRQKSVMSNKPRIN